MNDPVTGPERLLAGVEAVAAVDEVERRALLALPMTVRAVDAGQDIVREGQRTHESCVVIDGFLQRYKDLRDGDRQILAFHIAGDVPDLQSLHLPVLDHTLGAVTASTVAMVPHVALEALMERYPRIAKALWRVGLIDAAKFREWIVNVGGRPALPRLAHLFCELYVRSRVVGLGEPGRCAMPLTQARLAEALGLSVVHVNRVTVALRNQGLATVTGRQLHILDWKGLQEAGEFDPAYLHLRDDHLAEIVGD